MNELTKDIESLENKLTTLRKDQAGYMHNIYTLSKAIQTKMSSFNYRARTALNRQRRKLSEKGEDINDVFNNAGLLQLELKRTSAFG